MPFADNIFKCIFFNGNVWISIKISLKFVPKGPINNIPALVQIMAWRRPGNKPLSEPIMVSLLMHNASLGLNELILHIFFSVHIHKPSNGSWCMGIKGEMSGTVCVTFTWDMYIYIWVVYSLCFFCCLFITVTWWNVWCFEWASGNHEEVQACLVTLWLFIISCYSLYKTTLGLLCSWFENNPHFHKNSMDFHV